MGKVANTGVEPVPKLQCPNCRPPLASEPDSAGKYQGESAWLADGQRRLSCRLAAPRGSEPYLDDSPRVVQRKVPGHRVGRILAR
jgi:hypothetical protein